MALTSEKPAATRELLTTAEVAELCGLGARTVWRWAHSGRMPAPLKLGDGRQGAVRFRRRDLEEWVARGCPRSER